MPTDRDSIKYDFYFLFFIFSAPFPRFSWRSSLMCTVRHACFMQVHRDHVAMAADGLGIDYTVHWDGILNR